MSLEPITREEKMMDAIAKGKSVELTPITREEMFLAKAGGADVVAPNPVTRKEFFLSKISGGGGGAVPALPKDVNFYDYDGMLVYSYTLAEAQALTALPEGPKHEGLVFQGWNWALEKVKALTRPMNVGAMYITDDGKTRIWIHLEAGRTSPMLGCTPNGTVTVDWGDGTANDTLTGDGSAVVWTNTHNYAAPGDYIITLTVEGTVKIVGDYNSAASCILRYSPSKDERNRAYLSAVRKVEIGAGVLLDYGAFWLCYNLSKIVIPNGLTFIPGNAFWYCYNLSAVVIPNGVTRFSDSTFQNCCSLTSITIPDSVTSMGSSVLAGCTSLTSITIPDSVTSMGSSVLVGCTSLTRVSISDSVTTIRYGCFDGCPSLTSVTIPDGVTSIEAAAFRNCYGVAEYHLKPSTPPTLANANAFNGIPADCVIYVPAGSLEAYKTATNWATYADKMVEEG